jgi:hypothetical protein
VGLLIYLFDLYSSPQLLTYADKIWHDSKGPPWEDFRHFNYPPKFGTLQNRLLVYCLQTIRPSLLRFLAFHRAQKNKIVFVALYVVFFLQFYRYLISKFPKTKGNLTLQWIN